MTTKFKVTQRYQTGKGINRRLRTPSQGIPQNSGVVYGIKEPVNISMFRDQAWRFIKENARSAEKLFDLEIVSDTGATTTKRVIVQDYQISPVTRQLLHVDFREIKLDTIVDIEVPISTIGEDKVTKLGGVLHIVKHAVLVRGKIKDIPVAIEVDIDNLELGGSIHANDMILPEGISLVTAKNDNYTIITTAAAKQEAEEEVETDHDAKVKEATASDADSSSDSDSESAPTSKGS
ncbi:MAG: 50S ribosomal protein L25 [SAR324 cluster bacterium]|nr:50S ribosomal protein L25 [SAR324 cluster bacterium]